MNKILIDSILCFIGILIYFTARYDNRKSNTKLSFKFWINDNWPELTSTLLLNVAIMIIIHLPDTSISFDETFSKLPFALKVAGPPTLSFLLGLGLTSAFYRMFKEKTKIKK